MEFTDALAPWSQVMPTAFEARRVPLRSAGCSASRAAYRASDHPQTSHATRINCTAGEGSPRPRPSAGRVYELDRRRALTGSSAERPANDETTSTRPRRYREWSLPTLWLRGVESCRPPASPYVSRCGPLVSLRRGLLTGPQIIPDVTMRPGSMIRPTKAARAHGHRPGAPMNSTGDVP